MDDFYIYVRWQNSPCIKLICCVYHYIMDRILLSNVYIIYLFVYLFLWEILLTKVLMIYLVHTQQSV
jgi:hypothetical protein